MSTKGFAASILVAAVAATVGCRSVEVPRERYFRLDLPAPSTGDPQRAGILRVLDLQLGTALDSDCLLVVDGARIEPRTLERWVAPLDRLITDALVLGLSRARVCALVKGGTDPGLENWSLHGRIVEFAEVQDSSGSEARIALELWLLDAAGVVMFQDEFQAKEKLSRPGPEAAVAALSRGLQGIVDGVVQRMQADGLFAAARPPVPAGR